MLLLFVLRGDSPIMPIRNSPFRWPGAKDAEADRIVELLPDHRLYVEVFGGSAAVLFTKERSGMEVYNDINGDLVNFMRVLRDSPDALLKWLWHTPFSREIYENTATRWYKDNERPTDSVARAGEFFFLRYANFGGKSDQKAGFGIGRKKDNAQDYQTAREDLETFSDRISGVHVERLDWLELIEKYDCEDAVFYLDPPYPGTEYVYGDDISFDLDDLTPLNDLEGDWIVSAGEVATEVLDAEHSETKQKYRDLGSGENLGAKDSIERLWCSFDPRSSAFRPNMESATDW